MSETLELTVSKVIPAPKKDLFEAWLTVDGLKSIMIPGEGMTVPHAECDPQVGGSFLVVMKAGDKEMPHSGEYKTVDRYDTIAFTWNSEFTTVDSLVTITFEELNDTETNVTLHHAGFDNEEQRDGHKGGWTGILDALDDHFKS